MNNIKKNVGGVSANTALRCGMHETITDKSC
jgi:hypothetical protein